jgi:hypothetical protein
MGINMNRDEILKRNKQAAAKDEGEQYVEMQSRRFGEIGLSVFFIALILYKFLKGLPANDLLAVFWGYLGVGYIYKYKFLKTKGSFFNAVCGMIAAICFALVYILQTW